MTSSALVEGRMMGAHGGLTSADDKDARRGGVRRESTRIT